MIKGYGRTLRRWLLEQRISMLRADIFVALERKDNARITIESVEAYVAEAQKKLRRLQAKLILSDSPRTLLEEALK